MYNSRIMIALDFNSKEQALDFLNKFGDQKLFVKIGMELFYKEGPSIVTAIKALGHNIFLDLKLYDIPNTVKKAIHSLGSLGVDMLTIHTSGGDEMLHHAALAASEYNLNLLGVTVLTSQSIKEMPKTDYSLEDVILDLAIRAKNSNLYGIICSAIDIENLSSVADELNFITPGIRLSGDDVGDQKRVMDPQSAILAGANFLVIGRPITMAHDPVQTYKQIQMMIGEKNG